MKYLKFLSLIFLGLLIVISYSYRLNFPPDPYYDETYYIPFFHSLIHDHKYIFVSIHPLLWGELTSGFLAIGGGSIAIWRLVSLIAGLLSIFALYVLTKRLTKSSLTASFAVFFFTLDCISITQARIAMMNSLALLFMLIALIIFLDNWMKDEISKKNLLFTGIFLGLALATKLTSVAMILLIGCLYIQKIFKIMKNVLNLAMEGFLSLLITPIIIYFLSYCWILLLPGYSWHDIWQIQVFNYHYTVKVAPTQTHLYSSSWWGWPLLLRPIWFYFNHHFDRVNGILCIGNPACFWMIPVMTAYLCWDWFRQARVAAVGIILFGFLSQWLFYALSPRLTFFHYMYFSMPFLAMGLAWICAKLWQKGRWAKSMVSLYMILVFGMFIYWYPLLTGLVISEKYFENHMWFSSWI